MRCIREKMFDDKHVVWIDRQQTNIVVVVLYAVVIENKIDKLKIGTLLCWYQQTEFLRKKKNYIIKHSYLEWIESNGMHSLERFDAWSTTNRCHGWCYSVVPWTVMPKHNTLFAHAVLTLPLSVCILFGLIKAKRSKSTSSECEIKQVCDDKHEVCRRYRKSNTQIAVAANYSCVRLYGIQRKRWRSYDAFGVRHRIHRGSGTLLCMCECSMQQIEKYKHTAEAGISADIVWWTNQLLSEINREKSHSERTKQNRLE